ncbi:MAG: cysteine desulfurase [Alphaproteobacteria bacterium]|jgi:cysteine desulfurase/selenocysteine lyase|nr:cysteine desulfurase [Alphaproteobacteria bacterium]
MKLSKKIFPIFNNKKDLVYLDSASSAQKPQVVIDSIKNFYENDYSNSSRGACPLSENVTSIVEGVRGKVKNFINAEDADEILFTGGATESINILAGALADYFNDGDEVIITDTEHHSNILPWHLLAEKKDIKLNVLEMNDDGSFDFEKLNSLINENTRMISFSPMSNVLGTIINIENVVSLIRNKESELNSNILINLDLCQYIVHRPVDLKKWNVDFACFSSHKIYGPTGVGVLYCHKSKHNILKPYKLGGGTVSRVNIIDGVVKLNKFPTCFEAGTLPIAQIVGLGSALDFVSEIGYEEIIKHDEKLTKYALEKMKEIDFVNLLGTDSEKTRSSIISFNIDGINAFDFAVLMGQSGVCLRVGTSCADPLHYKLNITHSFRISFGIYNEEKDIDIFVEKMHKVVNMLK